MAPTSAQLMHLLGLKTQYAEAVKQQAVNSSRHETYASKLAAQQKAEEKWNDAYDSAYDKGHYGTGSDLKAGNVKITEGVKSEIMFSAYADAKVKDFDREALEEYSELDLEYELQTTTYDTMVTELSAMIESLEESVSNGAQDTGLLGS